MKIKDQRSKAINGIKFVDLAAENKLYAPGIKKRWDRIGRRGLFLNGPERAELEQRFKDITGKWHAISVKNGTDAITLLVGALWKPGMKVILPNFGAYPTAFSVARVCGPENIVFVDVDKNLFLDPAKLPPKVKNGIVITVNLFGQESVNNVLNSYVSQNRHQLIVDCAQSFGIESCFKKRTNEIMHPFSKRRYLHNAHFIFSFYPTKNMGSFGDGGMICTNSVELAYKTERSRFYGYYDPFSSVTGLNSRMDEWQCAVVNEKLQQIAVFHSQMDKTRKIANSYGMYLGSHLQQHKFQNNWLIDDAKRHMYPVLFPNKKVRVMAVKVLDKHKIPWMVHYDHHVSELPAFKKNKTRKVGYRVNDRILSIPLHPYLSPSQTSHIFKALRQIRKRYAAKNY